MIRFIAIFSFLLSVMYGQTAPEIRIVNLLPYFVQPPMVDPCLPVDFTLGKQAEDPYFSRGYHWGTSRSLSDYFEDSSQLKGCLIRAQPSTTVTQLGHDRFSNDGNTQDLTAAGFTEIKVSRGRWGIFPYREITAKGPKGRRYYQMWVGLNSSEGATLYFQFIYPEYLNEPTQTQKSIWSNFVKKTDLMNLSDLMVAKGMMTNSESSKEKSLEQKIGLRIEKRQWDQKYFVVADQVNSFSVLSLKEKNFLENLSFGPVLLEIEALLGLNDGSAVQETLRASFEVVDHFSFEPRMLQIDRFCEHDNLILFY